jgi:hypothetical protein
MHNSKRTRSERIAPGSTAPGVSARDAIRLDSTRTEGHRVLAAVLEVVKDAPGLWRNSKRVVALNPTDDAACYSLGRTYHRIGRSDEEKAIYLATIARRPHCWQPYWWLASWYFARGMSRRRSRPSGR